MTIQVNIVMILLHSLLSGNSLGAWNEEDDGLTDIQDNRDFNNSGEQEQTPKEQGQYFYAGKLDFTYFT